VIASNSIFTYKAKPVKVQQVSEELGVQYVLEGSIRKAEDRIRITAQLVDAVNGRHLWSGRYDRDLKDIFALQDEITMKVISQLHLKLTAGEQARVSAIGTKNLEAYLKVWEAIRHLGSLNRESNAAAQRLTEEAVALDPEYPTAYSTLAITHWLDRMFLFTESPKQSSSRSKELFEKALAIDPSHSSSYAGLCGLFRTIGQYEKAIAAGEKAVALAPSSDFAYRMLGGALRDVGRDEESLQFLKKAARLNPFQPSNWFNLGFTHISLNQCEAAIRECKKAADMSPNNLVSHICLAEAYIQCDREEEARTSTAEIMRIDPKFSLANLSKSIKTIVPERKERTLERLRKAGLK
jgi:adenylate cyclase